MIQIYKYFRWLSLDIVVGAIFFLAFLEKWYALQVGIHTYIGLASAIWLIYTADHLIDASKLQQASTQRHQFHQEHFGTLRFIAILVLVGALVNCYWMDETILRNGILLSAISVTYLSIVYFFRKFWVKEVLVAMVYGAGVFLAPFSLASFVWIDYLLVAQLIGVALLNLLIFSYYDYEKDQQDGFRSVITRMGMQRGKRLIGMLSISLLIITVGIGYLFPNTFALQLLYAGMVLILGVIFTFPRIFDRHERFRVVGDGIFFLPVIWIWWL